MTSIPDNQGGYQGYPYTNPIVTDVQSVDTDTASRWNNLPRKQIVEGRQTRRGDNQNSNGNSEPGSIANRLTVANRNEAEEERSRNVNIDLPIIQPHESNQTQNDLRRVQNNSGYQGYPYGNPIIINVQSMDTETALNRSNLPRNSIIDSRENPNRHTSAYRSQRQNQKPKDAEEPPMTIFIDVPTIDSPEINGRQDETRSGEDISGFVEDTIFYDPFEDRRINLSRNQESQSTDTGSTTIQSPSGSETRILIDGSSSGPDLNNQAPNQSPQPPYRSTETTVYRQETRDTFLVSPIPISEFPEPPPAYSEIDRRVTERPRTVVVVPDPNTVVGIASENRKFLICPHCSLQVHTIVIQENGVLTHVLAGIFLFVFAPITCVIYGSNYCKYRNHYCPNCNQLIGYEVPILCQDMVYTRP